MLQSIHDTNMLYIDTCKIIIHEFYIGRTGILVNGIHYLEPQKTSFPLQYGHVQLHATSLFGWGWWDNCDTLIIMVFLYQNMLFIDEQDKESTTPWLW